MHGLANFVNGVCSHFLYLSIFHNFSCRFTIPHSCNEMIVISIFSCLAPLARYIVFMLGPFHMEKFVSIGEKSFFCLYGEVPYPSYWAKFAAVLRIAGSRL